MRIIDLIPQQQRQQLIQELAETATADEKKMLTEALRDPISEDIEKGARLARERNGEGTPQLLGKKI